MAVQCVDVYFEDENRQSIVYVPANRQYGRSNRGLKYHEKNAPMERYGMGKRVKENHITPA